MSLLRLIGHMLSSRIAENENVGIRDWIPWYAPFIASLHCVKHLGQDSTWTLRFALPSHFGVPIVFQASS